MYCPELLYKQPAAHWVLSCRQCQGRERNLIHIPCWNEGGDDEVLEALVIELLKVCYSFYPARFCVIFRWVLSFSNDSIEAIAHNSIAAIAACLTFTTAGCQSA